LITKRQNDMNNEAQGICWLQRIKLTPTDAANNLGHSPPKTYSPLPSAARQKMVTQQAINILTIQEQVSTERIFTPNALMVFA
jgi:hypothetical protein